MQKSLVIVIAFAAVTWGDVSHLFNQPQQKPFPKTFPVPQPQPQPQVQSRYEHNPPHYVIIPILRQSQDADIDGNFNWGYEGGNGIIAQEQSVGKRIGPEEVDQTVQGEYKYTSPEGELVFAKYIADKYGFRIIEASHVPTSPPPSAEILKSLEYNAAHPEENQPFEKKVYHH